MAADVAQCGSSRIKSYTSAFSNILINVKKLYKKIDNEMARVIVGVNKEEVGWDL